MYIYFLILLLILLLIISYFILDKDVIEPSILFIISYILSVFCAIVNVKNWGINMKLITFLILLFGALESVLIAYFTKKTFSNISIKKNNVINTFSNEKKINKVFLIFIIIYNFFALLLLFYNVYLIASSFGEISNFSDILFLYKSNAAYTNNASLPDYITILIKPIIGSAYVYIYVFIKKLVFSGENKFKTLCNNFVLLIPGFQYIIQRVFESNRGSIINYILTIVVIFFILVYKKYNWKFKIKLKNIAILFLTACFCFTLFYLSTTFIGRKNSKNFIDYITCYAGGSIASLDLYFGDDDKIRVIKGEETFNATLKDLQKFGIVDKKLYFTNNAPFRYYGDNMIGNVYTAYKRFYHDFGFLGAMLLNGLMMFIFCIFYNIIKYFKINSFIDDLLIIVYSYFIYSIFMHPIDSYFYTHSLTIYTVGVLLFIFIIYLFTYKYKKREYVRIVDKNNIKILSVTPALNLCGGVESYCMNYYRNLKNNISMDFITHDLKDLQYKKEIEKKGNKVFLLGSFNIKHFVKTIIQIKDFFRDNHDYDIIHCNMANASFFYFYYAKKYGIKIRIIHSHQNKYADKRINALRNIPLIYFGKKLSTDYFACSKIAGDFLFKKAKYYIINNAIDISKYSFNSFIRREYRKKYKIKNKEILIGHVGRFCAVKNHVFIIKFFDELVKINNNFKLLLIGDGQNFDYIKGLVEKYNLEKNVIFVGSVDNVCDYLNAMDIFVLPSLYEGLGIVNIESQASGLHTIVSDKVPCDIDLSDLVCHLPLDSDLWINTICKLKKVGKRKKYNNIMLKTNYNILREADKLNLLYEKLINERY